MKSNSAYGRWTIIFDKHGVKDVHRESAVTQLEFWLDQFLTDKLSNEDYITKCNKYLSDLSKLGESEPTSTIPVN